MKVTDGAMPTVMDDEGCQLTASDGSPLHSLANATDGEMPAVKELTDGGVPPDEWAKSTDGRVPSMDDDERLLTASDGPPLHSQARVTVGAMSAAMELTDGGVPAALHVVACRLTAAQLG